jgi:hypothetical protein
MKTNGIALAVWAGLFVSLNLLFNATSTLAFTSDELSVIAVVEQTTPTPAVAIPAEGTFYSAKNLDGPPLPGNLGLPCWNLGSGVWLVDDLVTVSTSTTRTSTKSMSMMAQDVPAPPGDGGTNDGSGYTNSFVSTPIDTNGLWLEITNYDGNNACLNLHNGTDYVYCVKSTTDMTVPASLWQVEQEFFPTGDQTNCLPFTVATLNRTNLFLKAEDWTGVTENGNTIPDWWFYLYYGTTALSDTNLDSQNNTLLSDYESGTDPNVISFTIESTNEYVNGFSANLQLDVTAGAPSYYAVLVNDGNPADADWLPFTTTNLNVALGVNDGVYDVSIGLRGLPANATQTWESYAFILSQSAPVVNITSPALAGGTATVIKPYLQLQGFADKPLASLSYDISNATGIFTNLDAVVTGQTFDTNRFDFTTNYFQAYDVPLTTNANSITLHVTDRSGSVTTTNFNVVLDYTAATNPPTISLIWPQDGMAVSGNSCSIQGRMSDETGTIQAQVVNGDGTTNLIAGMVERDNMFWVENAPLNGTNQITLQATDAAGNVTTTNFTVIQSSLVLTIDSTPTGEGLYQSSGHVSGTVSDPAATVTINGVPATMNGNNWSADNVPVNGSGTATFDAVASMAGQPPVQTLLEVEMDAEVEITFYEMGKTVTSTNTYGPSPTIYSYSRTKSYAADYETNSAGQWGLQSYLGTVWDFYQARWGVTNYSFTLDNMLWSDQGDETSQTNSDGTSYYYPYILSDWDYEEEFTSLPDADLYGMGSEGEAPPQWIYHYWALNVHQQLVQGTERGDATVSARTEMKLFTGGKAGVGRKNLICLQCGGTKYGNVSEYGSFGPGWPAPWVAADEAGIDPTSLIVMGVHPNTNGNAYVIQPDNAAVDLNLFAPGVQHYDAWARPTKYLSHFEVFVYMPWPLGTGPIPPNDWTHHDNDYGHAWWHLTTDAPSEGVSQFMSSTRCSYMMHPVGYGCTGCSVNIDFYSSSISITGPGILYNPDGDPICVYKKYNIGFNDLINGLGYTKELNDHPGTYDALYNNCVVQTCVVGKIVGVTLPDEIYPEYFGLDLVSMSDNE